jgi:enoyl-CoA hydratase
MGRSGRARGASGIAGVARDELGRVNFKRRAETVGWEEAVRDRDNGTWDWTENRPINAPR